VLFVVALGAVVHQHLISICFCLLLGFVLFFGCNCVFIP